MAQPKNKKKSTAPPDPLAKFRHGIAFIHAAGIISDQATPAKPHLGWPTIVCRAFAFELLLKCLIELEGGRYNRVHNLVELFQCLSTASQAKIKADSIARSKGIVPASAWANFNPDAALDKSKEAFDNFRYWFEPPKMMAAAWMADPLLMATENRIIELRSDWFPIALDPNAP